MYSPAERPSSTRAAPAKKRIWSSMGGISSERVSARGLPVLRPSAAMKSSALASMASASLSSSWLRSDGVVSRQLSKARPPPGTPGRHPPVPDRAPRRRPHRCSGRPPRVVLPSLASTGPPSTKLCSRSAHCASASPWESLGVPGPANHVHIRSRFRKGILCYRRHLGSARIRRRERG